MTADRRCAATATAWSATRSATRSVPWRGDGAKHGHSFGASQDGRHVQLGEFVLEWRVGTVGCGNAWARFSTRHTFEIEDGGKVGTGWRLESSLGPRRRLIPRKKQRNLLELDISRVLTTTITLTNPNHRRDVPPRARLRLVWPGFHPRPAVPPFVWRLLE